MKRRQRNTAAHRSPFPGRTMEQMRGVRGRITTNPIYRKNMLPVIAEAAVAKAGLVVLVGMKAAESTGRNPASFGKVLVISILLSALVEGVAFVAIFMG